MEHLEKPIETSYQSEIANLYKNFFEAMLIAQDNASMIKGAEDRFKAGLERAAEIHMAARRVAGLFAI